MTGLGKRSFKTALAVFICFLTSDILRKFGIETLTFYAAIAAVFAMQPTLGETKNVGSQRILGTLVGAVFAIVAFSICINIFNSMYHTVFVSVAVLFCIATCVRLGLPLGVPTACIIVISAFSTISDTYIQVITFRVIETMYGVVVALAINYFIYPPKHQVQKII